MSSRTLLTAAAAAVSIAPLASAAPILIDDFSTTSASYPIIRTTTNIPGGLSGLIDTATVLGGKRFVGLGGVTFEVPGLDSARASVFTTGPGVADFQSSSGATVNFGLAYGGVITGIPLNLDFSSVVSIDIELLNYDAPSNAPMNVSVLFTSSLMSGTALGTVTPAGPQTLSISTASVPASVLADIDGISLFFSSPKAADYRINTISAAIPEPAAISLLAVPAALLTRRRRSC